MCGRFTLYSSLGDLKKVFAFDAAIDKMSPSYNIAPGDEIAAIIRQKDTRLGKLHWGLVPPWAKTRTSRLINARVETLEKRPSFKRAFQKKRCVIPADGFYEWKEGQPWYCLPADGKPFAFAGLWETWKEEGHAPAYHSCTIITAESEGALREIHDRMPLILHAEAIGEWLNQAIDEHAKLHRILKDGRVGAAGIKSYPVSRFVDSPKNNDPRCIRPLSEGSVTPR